MIHLLQHEQLFPHLQRQTVTPGHLPLHLPSNPHKLQTYSTWTSVPLQHLPNRKATRQISCPCSLLRRLLPNPSNRSSRPLLLPLRTHTLHGVEAGRQRTRHSKSRLRRHCRTPDGAGCKWTKVLGELLPMPHPHKTRLSQIRRCGINLLRILGVEVPIRGRLLRRPFRFLRRSRRTIHLPIFGNRGAAHILIYT